MTIILVEDAGAGEVGSRLELWGVMSLRGRPNPLNVSPCEINNHRIPTLQSILYAGRESCKWGELWRVLNKSIICDFGLNHILSLGR